MPRKPLAVVGGLLLVVAGIAIARQDRTPIGPNSELASGVVPVQPPSTIPPPTVSGTTPPPAIPPISVAPPISSAPVVPPIGGGIVPPSPALPTDSLPKSIPSNTPPVYMPLHGRADPVPPEFAAAKPPTPPTPPKGIDDLPLDELMDMVEKLRTEKAALDKRETELLNVIRKKAAAQKVRMEKLGVHVAPAMPPIPVIPIGGVAPVIPIPSGGSSR
jgi:hypothetical protein